MQDEKTPTETQEKPVAVNPLLEEAKAMAERLELASATAKKEADRLEILRTEQLLSGTAGIRPPMPDAKPESPSEYRRRIEAELRTGKFNAGK